MFVLWSVPSVPLNIHRGQSVISHEMMDSWFINKFWLVSWKWQDEIIAPFGLTQGPFAFPRRGKMQLTHIRAEPYFSPCGVRKKEVSQQKANEFGIWRERWLKKIKTAEILKGFCLPTSRFCTEPDRFQISLSKMHEWEAVIRFLLHSQEGKKQLALKILITQGAQLNMRAI